MIESYQEKKRVYLLLSLIGTVLLILSLCLRAIPPINDTISGKPDYMRWIADRVARSIASRFGDEAAVIAVRDEKTGCRHIADVTVPNPNALFYVVGYSETGHSLCFLTYARLPEGWDQTNSLVLYPKMGRNYGQRFERPVRVVAVSQLQIVYPLAYLSLLRWRAKIDPSSFARATQAKFERWFNSSTEPAGALDIEIEFASLRADVGRNHRIVNRVLAAAIFAAILLIMVAAYGTWTSYTAFRAFLVRYRRQVGFQTYLRQDLSIIASQARQAYQEVQKRAVEEARAAILFKRSKEAIRGRLESLLNALSDNQQKLRVQECLNRGNLEEMKSLTLQLQGQAGQKTAEEKLTALLDTLKQYCSGEEFDRFCIEAFQILATTGFKEARSFVVESHDQLRARSKELEEEETVETE